MRRASLNHVFRLVWNVKRQAWVAASELSRGRRKSGKISLAASALLLPLAALGGPVTVAPGSGSTQTYNAPNGVPVVNIDRANAQGLSHNRYLDYNVGQQGLVLNNANVSRLQRDSKLAGRLLANPNLDREARFILNEVVSTNPSQLLGYTEVLGGRSDVIVANPYGITCNGCGFINTDRVTLTTGIPRIDGGLLNGFNVRRGQVIIGSRGADASDQEYFDLVARRIRVEGAINAGELRITAGSNSWNYASNQATAQSADSDASTLAIDATALGGMYANRIFLQSTEAGVGVRMHAEAAATAGDFVITAAGQIEMVGAISATSNLRLNSNDRSDQAIQLNNAQLTAQQQLTLNSAGGINSSGGSLVAGDTLSLTATQLSDQASSDTDPDNNRRFAKAGVDLNISGQAQLDGVTWGSGTDIDASTGSLTVGNEGAFLYAGGDLAIQASAGNLLLANASVLSRDSLILNASGEVSTGNGSAQQLISETGALQVAAQRIDNQGLMAAGSSVSLTADEYIGNSGDLYSAGNLQLETNAIVNNSGQVQADQQLQVDAGSLTNTASGQILGQQGSQLQLDRLNNQGNLVLSNSAAALAQLRVGDMTNSGIVQAQGDLEISIVDQLVSSGELLSGGNMSIDASGADSRVHVSGNLQSLQLLTVAGDTAQSAPDLLIDGAGQWLASQMDLTLGSLVLSDEARLASLQDLELRAETVSVTSQNAALIAATSGGEGLLMDIQDTLDNSGAIHSGSDFWLDAGQIINRATGGVSSRTQLLVGVRDDLLNNGAFFASNQLHMVSDGTLHNQDSGTLDANEIIRLDGLDVVNNGRITSAGDVLVSASRDFVNETTLNGQVIAKALGGPTDVRSPTSVQIGNEGGADEGMNVFRSEDSITRDEYLVGITPEELDAMNKAQIIATGADGLVSVAYGESGLNRVALISGQNVELVGGDNAVFQNESLSLYSLDLRRRWIAIDDQKSGADQFVVYARVDPTATYRGQGVTDDGNPDSPDNDDNNIDNWAPGPGWQPTAREEGSGGVPPSLINAGRNLATTGAVLEGAVLLDSFGAGIYADNLQVLGGSIENIGSPFPGVENVVEDDPTTSTIDEIDLAGTDLITLGGFEQGLALQPVDLPTNPNGFFVPASNPSTGFLVETNPLFTGSELLGSDYLIRLLGLDVDQIGLRLGDAAYESYLIRQQLINALGTNLINGLGNEEAVIAHLYTGAADQAEQLGLTWGEPLSEQQVADLSSDIVWMVSSVIDGKQVLVPQVYLASDTREAYQQGAVIQANFTEFQVDGLTNTGGDIRGRELLSVSSKGNIENISGRLSGGNVVLQSDGSFINRTLADTRGDDFRRNTVLGQQGQVEADGNLIIQTTGDIQQIGAAMRSGQSTQLDAGGEITFDTIENRYARSDQEGTGGNSTMDQTGTVLNIGSELTTGNHLIMLSDGDTRIRGSEVNVGGSLLVETGGDFAVESVENYQQDLTVTRKQGAKVGGGVWGREITTDKDENWTVQSSQLSVAGDALIDSEQDILVRGSEITVGGNAGLIAENSILIEEAHDRSVSTTKTVTEAVLSFKRNSDASATASASGAASGTRASGSASASAKAGNRSEMSFYRRTERNENENSSTGVASTISAGGTLLTEAGNDITLIGSDMKADTLLLNAENINVMAGVSSESKQVDESSTSFGIFVDSGASANANVAASANPLGVNANTAVGANASTMITLGVRRTQTNTDSGSTTHRGSTLTATGGSVVLNARENLTFQAADVIAAEHIVQQAGGDILNLSAQDTRSGSSSNTEHTAGIYLTGAASATGSASGYASVGGAGADASVKAKAQASAGIRYGHVANANSGSTVTQQVNRFQAGGDIQRKAGGEIRDAGTQLDAGQNIIQTATRIVEEEIFDETSSSTSRNQHEARIGVFVGVEAGAKASGRAGLVSGGASGQSKVATSADESQKFKQQNAGTSPAGNTASATSANASAASGNTPATNQKKEKAPKPFSAGITASYTHENKKSSVTERTAVTSSYRAGGDIVSVTTEDTQMVGTQMQAGRDILISAESFTLAAAQNSSSSSNTDHNASAGVDVNVLKKEVDLSARGGRNQLNTSSSTAVVGEMGAGGNIVVNTRSDLGLIGTNVAAGQGINLVSTDGDVNLLAATSESKASQSGFNVGGNLSVGKKGVEGGVGGGYQDGQATQITQRGVNLNAGSGDITLSAGSDVTAQGATMAAGAGAVNLDAAGAVNLLESLDSSSSDYKAISADITVEKDQRGIGLSGQGGRQRRQEGQATTISGNQVNINSGVLVDQQAKLEGDVTINAGERRTLALTDESSGFDLGVTANVMQKVPTKDDKTGGAQTQSGQNGGGSVPSSTSGAGAGAGAGSGSSSGSGNQGGASTTAGKGGASTGTTNNGSKSTSTTPPKTVGPTTQSTPNPGGVSTIKTSSDSALPKVTMPPEVPLMKEGLVPKLKTVDGRDLDDLTYDPDTNSFSGMSMDELSRMDSLILIIPREDGTTQEVRLDLRLGI